MITCLFETVSWRNAKSIQCVLDMCLIFGFLPEVITEMAAWLSSMSVGFHVTFGNALPALEGLRSDGMASGHDLNLKR